MDGSSAKPTKPYSAYISPVQSAKKEHTLRCLGAFDEQRWFDVARKSTPLNACMHACMLSLKTFSGVCVRRAGCSSTYITHYFNIPKVWSWVCQTPKAPLNTAPFAHSAYFWRASLYYIFFYHQIKIKMYIISVITNT